MPRLERFGGQAAINIAFHFLRALFSRAEKGPTHHHMTRIESSP
jgi:hypothetical protein